MGEIMATRSFTRNIEVKKPAAARKIHSALKSNEVKVFDTTIRDIEKVQKRSRKNLSSKLTHKY